MPPTPSSGFHLRSRCGLWARQGCTDAEVQRVLKDRERHSLGRRKVQQCKSDKLLVDDRESSGAKAVQIYPSFSADKTGIQKYFCWPPVLRAQPAQSFSRFPFDSVGFQCCTCSSGPAACLTKTVGYTCTSPWFNPLCQSFARLPWCSCSLRTAWCTEDMPPFPSGLSPKFGDIRCRECDHSSRSSKDLCRDWDSKCR